LNNALYLNNHLRGVKVPYIPEGCHHVFHQYTVRVHGGRRDAFMKHLSEKGVGSAIYYPVPIHQQTYYTEVLGYRQTLLEAEKAAAEVLSLPVHPGLSQEDLSIIIQAVNQFF
jgi:perosamine synthetase